MRRLLLHGGDLDVLRERLPLFKQRPGLLEKYLIASEVSLDVLDLLFSRIFGKDDATVTEEDAELVKSLYDDFGVAGVTPKKRDAVENLLGRVEKQGEAVEKMQGQFLDVQRQLSALQRQLNMQGDDVTQIAASVERRLGDISQACEERVKETERVVREEIQRRDATGLVGEVASAVAELRREMRSRASAEAVEALSEEVTRLKQEEQRLDAQSKEIARKEFVYDQGAPLEGIIAHLTQKCGGNVHEKGVVEVTASGILSNNHERYAPEHAVELGSDSEFRSLNEEGSWLCYDFKGRCVTPTSYTIRSYDSPHRPKSWDLEVSNDGRSWERVDRRKKNSDLTGDGFVTHNFSISPDPGGRFRFVRLRMTGVNHLGYNYLSLTALEVFGYLSLNLTGRGTCIDTM